MNCAANGIVLQILHLHGLVDNTLTSEGSITVNQDWDNRVSISSNFKGPSNMVLSSNSSHDNRIYALQMTWVGKYLDGEFLAVWIFSSERGTQVILNISRVSLPVAFLVLGWHNTLEFSENGLKRFPDHIC